jgi:antitoxin CptB
MAMGSGAQAGMAMETQQARLKRMTMRSWRRGTKEMDLILGPYADAHIAQKSAPDLDLYDMLLEENDQDLLAMILGQGETPARYAALILEIGQFARSRLARSE